MNSILQCLLHLFLVSNPSDYANTLIKHSKSKCEKSKEARDIGTFLKFLKILDLENTAWRDQKFQWINLLVRKLTHEQIN